MQLVKRGLSDKLYELFLRMQAEYDNNVEHDVWETDAWNELVSYLMELEKGSTAIKE